jgi:hypothetical protein
MNPTFGFNYGVDLVATNLINGVQNGRGQNVPFLVSDIRLNNGLLVKSLNTTVTNNMTTTIPAGSLVLTNVTAADQSNMFLSVYNATAGTTVLRQIALV